jgi:hypothetical protein
MVVVEHGGVYELHIYAIASRSLGRSILESRHIDRELNIRR